MNRPWSALTARHSTVLAVLTVGAAFAMVALGLALATLLNTPDEPPPVLRMQLHPPLVAPMAPQRPRCPTCGTVESIRMTEAGAGAAVSYVFAVRMNDGSLRHSSDSTAGRWQVGDGIQLLGGDRTWSQN